MSDCVLVLCWPDFIPTPADPQLSPALVAHALHRHLTLRYDTHAAYFWTDEPDAAAPAAEAFPRWGFRPLAGAPEREALISLAHGHPDKPHVILAMQPERAHAAVPDLQSLGGYVQIWGPGAVSPGVPWTAREVDPEECVERSLVEALHLATAHPTGVFVDWRHVRSGTAAPLTRHPESLARALLWQARLVGPVLTARFYGPWEEAVSVDLAGCLPLDFSAGRFQPEAGEDADEALRADLLALLDDPRAPRTWILVSDAAWLPNLLERAHARGIRVLLWPANPAAIPVTMRTEADGFTSLAAVLQPRELTTDRGANRIAQVTHTSVRASVHPARPDVPAAGLAYDGTSPGSPVGAGARLGPWVRLLYHVECTLRRSGWSKIAFRKLAGALSGLDEFGPTPTNALMWLNRAKAEGMLVVEQEPHRADPALRVTTCRPHLDHPTSRAAVEVPDRCLRLLRQMLQKMPWVSFKLLRSVLMREQWLGGGPYSLDELGIDEWLNFLIHDGAIAMTKEPNLENPDFPVTALRLNDQHPLGRFAVAEASEGKRLAAERAILAVDHFLTRNRKPWMAMSALRRCLENLGRDELQAVLQGLQNLGALITESYPNPQKEHYTTGCRLKLDEPIVTDTLGARNAIIRVTQYHQRYRNWVPLSKLEEELLAQLCPPGSPPDCVSWFLLLRDEGILELDQDAAPGDGWGSVRCRLNVTDAVVRAVVAEALGEAAFQGAERV